MTEQSIKVKVLQIKEEIFNWKQSHAFYQHFYLPKIGDRIDGIIRKRVSMETLENNNGEWDLWN